MPVNVLSSKRTAKLAKIISRLADDYGRKLSCFGPDHPSTVDQHKRLLAATKLMKLDADIYNALEICVMDIDEMIHSCETHVEEHVRFGMEA